MDGCCGVTVGSYGDDAKDDAHVKNFVPDGNFQVKTVDDEDWWLVVWLHSW